MAENEGLACFRDPRQRVHRLVNGLCVPPLPAQTDVPKPLVFTNGVFDILHRGHVTYLAQARALGACLVVGLNSDHSAKQLGKGPDRPLNGEEDRAIVLASLACVDHVILFDDPTPAQLIELVKPDILVKGGDYSLDAIVGADSVRARGGQVLSIPFEVDRSTTKLVEKIRGGNT